MHAMENISETSATVHRDIIRVRNLSLTVLLECPAPWPSSSPTLQTVLVSLTIPHNTLSTATTDDLTYSVDYAAISKSLTSHGAFQENPETLESLSEKIAQLCFQDHPVVKELSVRIVQPKALLHAKCAGIIADFTRGNAITHTNLFFIEDLACTVIIGVNASEREEKQRVYINLELNRQRCYAALDVRQLSQRIIHSVDVSSFFTLEAFASSIACTALSYSGNRSDSVTVSTRKPSALVFAEASEVEITRTYDDYPQISMQISVERLPCPPLKIAQPTLAGPSLLSIQPSLKLLLSSASALSNPTNPKHTAAIALGSNMGDRFANIELALRLLEAPGRLGFFLHTEDGTTEEPCVVIVNTSFMYETEPMYVTDQPKFINCACIIETDMGAIALLALLKDIESTVGRVSTFRNGPRLIDLDVLTYDSDIIDTRPPPQRVTLDNLQNELVVPHPRIAERGFVLRPLVDMIPDYVHPVLQKTVKQIYTELLATQPPDTPVMNKVIPFPRYPFAPLPEHAHPYSSFIAPVPSTTSFWSFPADNSPSTSASTKVYIMGTLNATPDSFSDGSEHNNIPAALSYVTSSVAEGAHIIDIGGYSTRPGANFVSIEEERARVVPVVQAIRALDDESCRDVLLSVDTFRWEVAEASVRAGANCINDVYAFTGPNYPLDTAASMHFLKMRAVARELAVPVVLMHSRGEASANKDYSMYKYAQDGTGKGAVLEGVRVELGDKVAAAVEGKGGLRRWLVIADPGIGFSKTLDGNLELLRDAAQIVSSSTPSVPKSHGISINRNPLAGYPQLIGTSRKSFLGTILEQPDPESAYEGKTTRPNERDWATAAAISRAVQQNAVVVRVHNVQGMGDVVRVLCAALRTSKNLCGHSRYTVCKRHYCVTHNVTVHVGKS